MRLNLIIFVMFSLVSFGGCFLFEKVGLQPKEISAESHILSREGWSGVAIRQQGKVIFEKYDSIGHDGRFDFWRYYADNKVIKEEVDRNSDDLIDKIVYYDLEFSHLIGVERDDNFDGKFDYYLHNTIYHRWEEKKDTNFDGIYDRRFLFKGPLDLLEEFKVDTDSIKDMKAALSSRYWVNTYVDDDNDGREDRVISYVRGEEVTKPLSEENDGRRFLFFGRKKNK